MEGEPTAMLRRLLFALGSGLLFAVAFPPYQLPYFLPLGVALLLVALNGATVRQGFYVGVVSAGVHTGATLFWLANLFAAAVLPLCVIVSSFPILFCTLWPWLSRRLPLAFAAVLWVGLEFYRAEPFILNFGWSSLGYSVAGRPVFAPLAATLGVYGISFLVFCLGSLRGRALAIATLLWAVACAVRLPAPAPENPLRVRLVQAFTDEEALYEKSTGVVHPDVILWPEYSLHTDPRVPDRLGKRDWEKLVAVAQKNQCHLVFGAEDWRGGKDSERYWNTAYVLSPEGTLLGTHAKNHPVHFVKDGVAGTEARAIPTALGRLGISICFDNDYPEVDRKLAQDGAEVFLVPNMDPAEWGPVQQAQHTLLFAMRAMENGKWLARADVAGGTSAVAPNGIEVARVKNGEAQVLDVTVGRTNRRTLYTLGGWVFGPVCCFLAVAGVLWCAFTNRRTAVQSPS